MSDPTNPYGQDPNNPYGTPPSHPGGVGGYVQNHPQSTLVLVLGILSLILCQVLGPFAWVMGNRALREIDANPGAYSGREQVNIGKILGIIATVLLGLTVIAVIFFIGFGVLAATLGS